MKSIHIELPDNLVDGLNLFVSTGWLQSEEEGIRIAIPDYLRRSNPDLQEHFLREDITWALSNSSPWISPRIFQEAQCSLYKIFE